jgi:integrase
LDVHVFPFWKGRPFLSIKRSDVTALLDDVEDDHGARQADCVLTVVSSIMHWFADRHDDYHPPVRRGMRRQNPKEQARERTLTDDELRVVWKTAEEGGRFGAIVRLCLLTAQRDGKVSTMRWSDVSDAGEWTIPKEPREKENGGVLVLPDAARAIIRKQHRLGDNPYVFASRGDGPFRGFSASKRTFDAKLPKIPHWTIHDLRRTSRSLMSRAGVTDHHAERVLGHAIGGVKGIYDRHAYKDEKAEALRKLAALIDNIVNPRANVVPITKRR